MNQIKKVSLKKLGYHFIPAVFLPAGKDEYYKRFEQNTITDYRSLSVDEIRILEKNGNRSDDWGQVMVREGIDITLIIDCRLYGLVRIGILEPYYLEFSQLQTPVGIYRSHIISCDIGNNVVINNVKLLSHYIIEDEVILSNVNEMSCTSHSKFGNGIIKDGESEEVRIWMEVCNENGGRKILPFDGMLPGDAWLWSKYRANENLMKALMQFTENKFDARRGTYGTVGKRSVIKNSHIIKDVKIGSDAYIKGANKLKNLTINSNENAKSQIGEGCELVNGIMGAGSRAFYGVKAVRFILAPFSQLKYGARLINSYLGENATISCCEVLNTLIFPAHEQHHNNSFLCASLIMGQSNIAAGATIGSNHNSRAADGEIQAGRGFWPGLCVSLKHNSKFASFTMIAKGDYPAELNIPLPFSLVSNNTHKDHLTIMPGYWFMYNMFAILRNEIKFADRDKRITKEQLLEFNCLAPDTVNEIFEGLHYLQLFTGKAFYKKNEIIGSDKDYIIKGKSLLEQQSPLIQQLDIVASGFENTSRPVYLAKVQQAYNVYKKMITWYGTCQLIQYIKSQETFNINTFKEALPETLERNKWINVGGQLITADAVQSLIENITSGKYSSWDDVHQFYQDQGTQYAWQKMIHGIISLSEILDISLTKFDNILIKDILYKAIDTKDWITESVYSSRAKDYNNPFKEMVYSSTAEMENVVGKLQDNSFINEQKEGAIQFKKETLALINQLG